ncbi:Putative helicase [Vibrio nigripulchritudo SFn27]|uniref:Putative helicase n=1 Tax=Vibrio nigripulchritudo TaxID=28173 RepID=U4KFZ4_9VIBR|nr:GIY-YIG nuclease family protein [Vibrio nigripulchritudo]CCN82657.1 Putative helicase [Vibrio nigripulchritudo BLFn1]CCN89807.1 Putative helicase [Vibrio nigripulchritudo SFn27]CCN92204.1 Putative helicase [Vibrio nigripulchritudo ENn2]CCO43691.1 Putative helicase [Vibrio nigripulchritudo SFn135]CCO53005.1 Putative helicase [Vibrio nigripulchritudo Wn13]
MKFFLIFIGIFFAVPFFTALARSMATKKKEQHHLLVKYENLKHEKIKSDQLYLDCEQKLLLANIDIESLNEKLRRVKKEPWYRESACVYVLRDNSCNLGIIKIGYTIRNPEKRMKELIRDRNYKNFSFELIGYIWTDGDVAEQIEKKVHRELKQFRFQSGYAKELFIYDPFKALSMIHNIKTRII